MSGLGAFTGPLFVVGMPRSGTKLLVSLLNRHPRIRLSMRETHCIPYFVKRYGSPPELRARGLSGRFLSEWKQTTLYRGPDDRGHPFDQSRIEAALASASDWAGVFREILLQCSPDANPDSWQGVLWGDRTPGIHQMRHLRLLKQAFPLSRVIHVYRDPRDVAASIRSAWGQCPARSAKLWAACMRVAEEFSTQWPDACRSIAYEALIQDPTGTMRSVSGYLGVEYVDEMSRLAAPVEDRYGSGRGVNTILADNRGRYLRAISPRQAASVEWVAGDRMLRLGYAAHSKHGAIAGWQWPFLAFHDLASKLAYHVRRLGLVRGALFYYRFLRTGA